MNETRYNLILADDDTDDCLLFREALEELPLSADLITVNDGAQLMDLLSLTTPGPAPIIFLDLNMPRKTGLECLSEIRMNKTLKEVPVIIFSTSLDRDVAQVLYEKGANYYIQKPGEFSKLKKIIQQAVITVSSNDGKQPAKENFILEVGVV